MKYIRIAILSLIISLPLSTAFAKANDFHKQLDYIFDLSTVSEITIEITPTEWNKLLAYYDENKNNEKYVKADFVFTKNGNTDGNTERVNNVGFRIRGNHFSRARPEESSYEHDSEAPQWNHAHFRVHFRKYGNKPDFHNLKSLNLKWFKGDSAYVREIYCFDLFRRFGVFTATRTAYTRLSIHIKGDKKPAYFGVYEMLEPIDSRFIKKRFPKNRDGYLWKCLYPADLCKSGAKNKMGVEDPDKCKNYPYDLKTKKKSINKAKAKFYSFIKSLNELEGRKLERWINKHIDTELFLRALAVNTVVGMWDDYWFNNNNYYIYLDKRNKLYFIPYDYDNTLGTAIRKDFAKIDVFEFGPRDGSRPLVDKILSIPKYEKMYSNYIVELIDKKNNYFHYSKSIPRIEEWQAMVEPYLENDTGYHDEIVDSPAGWGITHFYELTGDDEDINYFMVRENTIREQFDMEIENKPKPKNKRLLKVFVNMNKITAGKVFLKLTSFPSVELIDTGKNGDEVAGDNIYSGTISLKKGKHFVYSIRAIKPNGKPFPMSSILRPRQINIDETKITNTLDFNFESGPVK